MVLLVRSKPTVRRRTLLPMGCPSHLYVVWVTRRRAKQISAWGFLWHFQECHPAQTPPSRMGYHLPGFERRPDVNRLLPSGRYLLIIALSVSTCAFSGCVESYFFLANGSRLPAGLALPPGLTRQDVSVKLTFHTTLRGPDAKFVLTDKKGRKLASVSGQSRYLRGLEIIGIGGATEILTFTGGATIDHKLVEPTFAFIDDPARRKEILEELPTCRKRQMNQKGTVGNSSGGPCLIKPEQRVIREITPKTE